MTTGTPPTTDAAGLPARSLAGVTSFDTAIHQWREGERRLDAARPPESIAMERVTEAIYGELRKRLGGAFTVDELVDLYGQGTSWTLDLAVSVAPGAPWAWEQRIVADAAFARYVRQATDFAGGRRIYDELE